MDRSCPFYEELAGIFRKTVGLGDIFREALASLGDSVRLAFVLGFVTQGKERPMSDIALIPCN